MEYRCSVGAGVSSWGLTRGTRWRGVSAWWWLGLGSWGWSGWWCWAGGWLWRWCAGSLLICGQGLRCRGRGGLSGVRAPCLAMLLVLNLLEVLLASPHLSVFQLLHVEGLTVSQQLLPLVLQLLTETDRHVYDLGKQHTIRTALNVT